VGQDDEGILINALSSKRELFYYKKRIL